MLWLLLACSQPCEEREGDADCDGVPDAADRCPDTIEPFTDRLGCSERQAAGCEVRAVEPQDGARAPRHFRWQGDCSIYVLQTAPNADFLDGQTRTVWRGSSQERVVDEALDEWWRVVGAMPGRPGFATEARRVRP